MLSSVDNIYHVDKLRLHEVDIILTKLVFVLSLIEVKKAGFSAVFNGCHFLHLQI